MSNRNGRDAHRMGGSPDNGDSVDDMKQEYLRPLAGVLSLRDAGADSVDRILMDSEMDAVRRVRRVVRIRFFSPLYDAVDAKWNSATLLDLAVVLPLWVLARSYLRTARLKTRSAVRLGVQTMEYYYTSSHTWLRWRRMMPPPPMRIEHPASPPQQKAAVATEFSERRLGGTHSTVYGASFLLCRCKFDESELPPL